MLNKTSIKHNKCYQKHTLSSTGLFQRKRSAGQGAIEYLLLLGAAIIVVSIVVTFMANAIAPAQESGNLQTYAYICGPVLDSNTADCVCYHGNNDKGYFATEADATVYCCVTQKNGFLRERYNCD